ncbi:MAG: hypothetical protein V7717_12035 [Porticoccaceae bacterium]
MWRACFTSLLVTATGLALLPVTGDMWFPGQDKMMHAASYAVLYTLGWLSFPGLVFRWPLFVGLLCYGVVIEILQQLTGYRFMELWDVVANTLGLGLGCLGIFIWRRLLHGAILPN